MARASRNAAATGDGRGSHACLIFDSDDERRRCVTSFVADGLERREKVVYVTHTTPSETLSEWLGAGGLDTHELVASGRLEVVGATTAYLDGGTFSPARMVERLRELTADAVGSGFSGLRITGEMEWAVNGASGGRLLEYERLVDDFYASGAPAVGLCQYDRRRFDAATVTGAAALHPHDLAEHVHQPLSPLSLEERDGVIVPVGSIDRSNVNRFARAVDAVPAELDVRLDLRNVLFIDVAGLWVLYDAALARGRRGCRVVVASAPDWLWKALAILDWDVEALVLEQ